MSLPLAAQDASTVRSATSDSKGLSLANAFSLGLKPGHGIRGRSRKPFEAMVNRSPRCRRVEDLAGLQVLWSLALSPGRPHATRGRDGKGPRGFPFDTDEALSQCYTTCASNSFTAASQTLIWSQDDFELIHSSPSRYYQCGRNQGRILPGERRALPLRHPCVELRFARKAMRTA